MTRFLLRAATAVALSAAPAMAAMPVDRIAALTRGRVAGPPVDCINPERAVLPQIVDGQAIFYRRGGVLYANRFDHGCPTIREGKRITTNSLHGQLCRHEQFRVTEPGYATGEQCAFGPFTPYTRPKPPQSR